MRRAIGQPDYRRGGQGSKEGDALRRRRAVVKFSVPEMHCGGCIASVTQAVLRGDPKRSMTLKFVRVEPFVIPKRSLTGDNTERVDTRVLQVIYAVDAQIGRAHV